MRKLVTPALAVLVGMLVGVGLPVSRAQGPAAPIPGAGFAAIPGEKGGQDLFGAYELVADWPKPMSQLPGHEQWTWGSVEGIFAESPNRVFVAQRGELPTLERPPSRPVPGFTYGIVFPVGATSTFRNATTMSPENLEYKGTLGIDARWEHNVLVLDRQGNIIEDDVWKKWDAKFRCAHAVYISPYDREKHVWVVDEYGHAVYKFSNDGSRLVQTIGTPDEPGADERHFRQPTYLAWLPDGTMYVADDANTRVVKFDAQGRYLMTWGRKAESPRDLRPGYFGRVHGIATDPGSRRVFVNDRTNRRVQVFDDSGTFLHEWTYGKAGTSDAQTIYMTADRHLWVSDRTSAKMIKYDLDGHLLYSWGVFGGFPGGFWGVHQVNTDQEGNFYVAEVNAGRVQKFAPRPGANPSFLVGKPVRAAWQ
jgi:DNA-binding beta-propeller fold protein YncE